VRYRRALRAVCTAHTGVASSLSSGYFLILPPREPLNQNTSRGNESPSRTCPLNATFHKRIVMTRRCLRGRVPPNPTQPLPSSSSPSQALVKLTVKARDRRLELTFTSPCNPFGLLAACRTCLRPLTRLCLQLTVVLVVDTFFFSCSLGSCAFSRDVTGARACCVTSAQLWGEGWEEEKKKKKKKKKLLFCLHEITLMLNSYCCVETIVIVPRLKIIIIV